ncbi:polysaccharide pyruvyl transferase family protein [Clavibacter michiganensis subsp. insidiosus]|uniref:Polysaccharide pyruvyl transferase family protein n=1 Tax=Clavibacter michiganensis subsp. insidiosus TaxID=33014 RepID=A0A399N335_9MICO|nr:polysaccharide pyruvyl transferase family protein [Clavibacter michiganensis]AWG01414.1 pyruvyl transferase [Clavibacter michiganensis subsp. insidiosus]OQJ60051.1 pyruvyl transferase [Clavibacter michiganensis subsp. insidiosus]RII87987.1 polysaccharide pyruvyl transferase family protein [Clavibacter michiganensis subsp. insidiosus]RIJ13984.1 polysaccharide pyruvyl transferase family protein [Clavibacter michiganensis subsp. insidiosus]RMC88720.1 polysaccharide pyruvyl transferase family p
MNGLLLDPSISSANIGDQIIRENVLRALDGVVPITGSLPTQTRLTRSQRRTAADAELAIVGGTNLLSSNMPWYRQWKLDPIVARSLKHKVVLLGVGWWQYQDEPNRYTTHMLWEVLSPDLVHSVRDEYTKVRLERMGFQVVNTACPTMWGLDRHNGVASARPAQAILTLTDYNRDVAEDEWLIALAAEHYARVVIWPQSIRDAAYARTLTGDFTIAEPTLAAYDALLAVGDSDYIGTRLHGGVRALETGAWGVIVAVDNRALEISRDTGLPVHARGEREAIRATVERRAPLDVRLPYDEIHAWKAQLPVAG